jgi:hypothetical protein
MTECKECTGQGIGDSITKATKCVSFCSWPFEYQYDAHNIYGSSCENDGGLCTIFELPDFQDTECQCTAATSNHVGYDSSTSTPSASQCTFVNLSANIPAVATVFSVFIVIFIACVVKLPSKPGSTLTERLRMLAKLFFLAFFPALDFLSDLVYILTSKFNNISVFLASVFFFVLPM